MKKRPQISLLVPFRHDRTAPSRRTVWQWLKEYWRYELPDAEIITSRSSGRVFSKTEAINRAAARARGRIFVLLDSDTYMRGSVIQRCADTIEESLERGKPLWFIPYRHLYRLTREGTRDLLESSPCDPHRFPTPPDADDIESTQGSMHGHYFGAMIQVIPREGFEALGGMDPRFRGWGGEDIAFVRALDTLYGNHKTVDSDVLHLWHESISVSRSTRMWRGQTSLQQNNNLASRYNRATGDREQMRSLIYESVCEWRERYWRYVLLDSLIRSRR